MAWTAEETVARLAERERYRAEHPEFDDWFLRLVAREARRAQKREAWRQRQQGVHGDLSPGEKAMRRVAWKMGRGGRPLHRARVETLRQALVEYGAPDPSEGFACATVLMREQQERAEYRERRDAERAERDEAW